MSNRQRTILLHTATWVVLLLSPLTFMNHGESIDLQRFLMMCMAPLMLILVFYANYLWLTPKYFVSGEKRNYWLINIIMIIGLATLLHYWMSYTHHLFEHHPHREPDAIGVFLFILRNAFNLTVAAAIATTLQLSMRWQKAEQARKDAETARVDAELKTLRWQINPHFLLNTLNNIYALTAFDTSRAQESIQELSKMLRHILYDNQQPFVPLDEEIEFLHNYINLMKIRLPDCVDVRFDIERETASAQVAPMIFISLVENAFKHGVSPTRPSFIHIRLVADEHQITCAIENSNYPKTEQDRSGHGVGLKQVQRRLDLTYPGSYTWEKGVSDDQTIYQSTITLYENQLRNH